MATVSSKAQGYYFDSDTEKTISTLLQNKIEEFSGNGGEVYVMETQPGRIVAKVKSDISIGEKRTSSRQWLL